MSTSVRHADSKGRVTLPELANATVIVEKVSASEYRIRKARVIAEAEFDFPEEAMPVELSPRDAESLCETLAKPPKPNRTARKSAKEYLKNHGRDLGN